LKRRCSLHAGLAGTRASTKTKPSSDHVEALLDSAYSATHALGGKTEGRD
jgi:hypothetical protein